MYEQEQNLNKIIEELYNASKMFHITSLSTEVIYFIESRPFDVSITLTSISNMTVDETIQQAEILKKHRDEVFKSIGGLNKK